MIELVIATKNPKKKEEIERLLGKLNAKILTLADFPVLPEVIEDGKTFEENAKKKALTYAKFLKRLVLADDSGLEVDVLNGRPGIYSSRYSGKGATDEKNIIKLLEELAGREFKERRARFNCSVALADEKGIIGVVNAQCKGMIAFEPNGECGFGYDPLFIVPKFGKTFAELGPQVKDKLSHRAKAVKKAKNIILKYIADTSQSA